MKRYKLLKELPTFDAGDEFYLDSNNNLYHSNLYHNGSEVMAYNHKTLERFPNILKDWFEEIPESKRWRAEYGGEYAYTADDGLIGFSNDCRCHADNYRYRTGNYARGNAPGLLVECKEYNIARQTLLDDAEGGKYSYGEENWCTYYSKYTQEWTGFDNDIYHPGMIYFRTGEALQKSLEEHKEQWQIVRKYETKE